MTLLSVRSVTKRYARRSTSSVDSVSLELAAGSLLGLVGESGSGKSTLARCIAGLIKPDRGEILLDGRDVVTASRAALREMRRDMQMVFQDPYSSLNPRMTVLELVGEGLIVHGIEKNAALRRDRVVDLLERVGLSAEHLDRYPRSFSGGQRQRIAIARALAVGPRFLICDEPVSSLDVSVQAQVLNLLRDLQAELDFSVLFIAHDLAVVRYLCDQIAVMNQGRLVERGSRDEIFGAPQHPYTRSLIAAVPIPDPAAERRRRRETDPGSR